MGYQRPTLWNNFVRLWVVLLVLAWFLPTVSPPVEGASGKGTISGRVVNLAGKAVKGAKVVVTAWDIIGKDGRPKTWSTTTGSNGTFTVKNLPVGSYGIEVLAGRVGQSAQAQVKSGKTINLKFVLDPSANQGGVTGTVVVDAHTNVRINFSGSLYTPENYQWFALPDGKGRFQIGLPLGYYYMDVMATGRDGVTRTYQQRIELTSRKPIKVTIPLKASNSQYASIRGRLAVTAASIRILNVTVDQITKEKWLADRRWAVQFHHGKNPTSYHIANLPAGQYLITVHLMVPNRNNPPLFYVYQRIVGLKERQSLRVDFNALKPPATVQGQIVDDQGKPVAFAQVFAYGKTADNLIGFGRSADAHGRFKLALAEGTHRLVIAHPQAQGTRLVTKEITVSVKSGQKVDLGMVRLDPELVEQPSP